MIKLKEIDGELFDDTDPFDQLRHMSDLVYYDGPLVAHFCSYRRYLLSHYLVLWCDCDEEVNRWMIFRTSAEFIFGLKFGGVALDEAIRHGNEAQYVWLVDLNNDRKAVRAWTVLTEKLPDDYWPKPGTFIEPQEMRRVWPPSGSPASPSGACTC